MPAQIQQERDGDPRAARVAHEGNILGAVSPREQEAKGGDGVLEGAREGGRRGDAFPEIDAEDRHAGLGNGAPGERRAEGVTLDHAPADEIQDDFPCGRGSFVVEGGGDAVRPLPKARTAFAVHPGELRIALYPALVRRRYHFQLGVLSRGEFGDGAAGGKGEHVLPGLGAGV